MGLINNPIISFKIPSRFINPINSNKYSISLIKMSKINNPFPGTELSIPLLIFQNIFTNLHYNYDITNIQLIFFEIALAYYTYGGDRFFDSFESNNKNITIKESKKSLYKFYQDNKDFTITSLIISYLYITNILLQNDKTSIFIIPLTTTILYKPFKENFGQFKALYISIMWTLATVIIPCIMHDNNLSIISYPIDYIPAFLTIFASSNIADIKDIIEDRENNINTLPILLGEKNSIYLSILLLLLSNIIFFNNPNFFERPLINGFYEIQNFASIMMFFPSVYNSTIL